MRNPESIDLAKIHNKTHDYIVSDDITVGDPFGGTHKSDYEATLDLDRLSEGRDPVIGVFRGKGKYKLIENKEVIGVLRESLGDNITGHYREQDGKMWLYYYPEHWETDFSSKTTVGDVFRFGIRVTNSVDGSLGLGVNIVGHRLVCSNGMYVDDLLEGRTFKHTRNLDLGKFRRKFEELTESDGRFDKLMERFKNASEYQAEVPLVLERIDIPQSLRDVVIEHTGELNNMWEIYNAVTRIITHGYREQEGVKLDATNYNEFTLQRLHKQANKIILMAEQ